MHISTGLKPGGLGVTSRKGTEWDELTHDEFITGNGNTPPPHHEVALVKQTFDLVRWVHDFFVCSKPKFSPPAARCAGAKMGRIWGKLSYSHAY